jgi:hypothetical protein
MFFKKQATLFERQADPSRCYKMICVRSGRGLGDGVKLLCAEWAAIIVQVQVSQRLDAATRLFAEESHRGDTGPNEKKRFGLALENLVRRSMMLVLEILPAPPSHCRGSRLGR